MSMCACVYACVCAYLCMCMCVGGAARLGDRERHLLGYKGRREEPARIMWHKQSGHTDTHTHTYTHIHTHRTEKQRRVKRERERERESARNRRRRRREAVPTPLSLSASLFRCPFSLPQCGYLQREPPPPPFVLHGKDLTHTGAGGGREKVK